MESVNIADAKARLSELIGRAEAGEDVRISRRGRPVVRLVAVEEAKPRLAIDWDAIDRLRASLPSEPSMSVEEMRRRDLL